MLAWCSDIQETRAPSEHHPITSLLHHILFILAMLLAPPALAEQKPLWEVGLGVGAVTFPDYRGSDEVNVYPVPVPYVVYRGKFLRADREGVRGELFDRRYAEFTISADASVPVRSKDNDARRGMDDLEPTVELGPSLELHVWRSQDERFKVDAVMPVRLPFTVESSPQSIGWVVEPRINLDIVEPAGMKGWNLGLGVGPVIADSKFNQFVYSVDPRFATPQRPAYDAEGGYSGARFVSAISKRFPKYWVGAYLRYDTLRGAVFEDSPLVRRTNYISGGIGIAWMIGQSSTLVESDD